MKICQWKENSVAKRATNPTFLCNYATEETKILYLTKCNGALFQEKK